MVVGEKDSARTFLIHSQMLIKESDRLAIGVEKDFKEKEEKTITIKEEDPDLFGYFVVRFDDSCEERLRLTAL